MLVLARKQGESLRLGEHIEITVLKVSASGVSLGIRAPRSLAVVRGELAAAVQRENRAAADAAPGEAVLERLGLALGVGGAATLLEGEGKGTSEGTRGAGDRSGRREARQKAPKRRR